MVDGLKSLKVPRELLVAQKIARLTDSGWRIPFTSIRFGLDFIIGLVPFVGDLITWLLALSIPILASRMGAPKGMVVLMLRNTLFDFVFGLVPFIGDIVDLFYRANNTNVKMLESWWLQHNRQTLNQATKQKLLDWESQQT